MMSTNASTIDQRLARQAGAIHRDLPRRSTDFDLLANLRTWFGADFHLFDGETGDLLRSPPELRGIDFSALGEICHAVAQPGPGRTHQRGSAAAGDGDSQSRGRRPKSRGGGRLCFDRRDHCAAIAARGRMVGLATRGGGDLDCTSVSMDGRHAGVDRAIGSRTAGSRAAT